MRNIRRKFPTKLLHVPVCIVFGLQPFNKWNKLRIGLDGFRVVEVFAKLLYRSNKTLG